MPRTWTELAEIVKARRDQMGLTQDDVANRANTRMDNQVLSTATIRIIEAAKRTGYRPRTLIGLARALDWPDDAVPRLLAGAAPDSLVVADTAPEPELRLSSNDVDLNALADEDPEALGRGLDRSNFALDFSHG